MRLFLLGIVIWLTVPRSSQDGHRALPPDAAFPVLQRINVQQPPAGLEQTVDFLSSARFKVVPCKFNDVELPKWQCLDLSL